MIGAFLLVVVVVIMIIITMVLIEVVVVITVFIIFLKGRTSIGNNNTHDETNLRSNNTNRTTST